MGATAVLDNPHTSEPVGARAPNVVPDHERERRGWPGGEPTLDDLIVGAWEGLTALTAVACPVCGGTMEPERREQPGEAGAPESLHSLRARPVSVARCRHCGTSLS
jgi:hypothetical protein